MRKQRNWFIDKKMINYESFFVNSPFDLCRVIAFYFLIGYAKKDYFIRGIKLKNFYRDFVPLFIRLVS